MASKVALFMPLGIALSSCFNPEEREGDTDPTGTSASASQEPTASATSDMHTGMPSTSTSTPTSTSPDEMSTSTGIAGPGDSTGTDDTRGCVSACDSSSGRSSEAGATLDDDDSSTGPMSSSESTGTPPRPDFGEGLALLLPMDEDAWAGSIGEVHDVSGNQNHGVAHDATTTADGRFGRAGWFDGAGSVVVEDHASLRPSDALTISAWIYPTEIGASDSYGIVSKRRGFTDLASYSIWISPSGTLVTDIDLEADRFESHALIETYRWTHVAVVFDGTQVEEERVSVYIDGLLDIVGAESSAMIPGDFTADLHVGHLPNGGNYFVGAIDEVAVWSRVLSEGEIATLAEATGSLADLL